MKTLPRLIALSTLSAVAMLAHGPFGVLTSTTALDPATIVQRQVTRLTNLLSLTTAQATQATTIFTNALTAIDPLETTLNTDFTNLQTAVKNNATSTIDQLSSNIGSLTGQITAIQNKADAAFYAILTSDQQTKLNAAGGFGGRGLGLLGPGGHPLR